MLDGKQLTRAILNVLLNALEACKPGGHVRLSSAIRDGVCRILVEDDGPGLPETVIEQVFDALIIRRSRVVPGLAFPSHAELWRSTAVPST